MMFTKLDTKIGSVLRLEMCWGFPSVSKSPFLLHCYREGVSALQKSAGQSFEALLFWVFCW